MLGGLVKKDLVVKTMLNIGYTRSTPEPSALSLRVTVVGEVIVAFGCGSKMLPLQ